MRRCEVVVVFIGLELDTFSSRIYDSFSPRFRPAQDPNSMHSRSGEFGKAVDNLADLG
jgi:hypothetical protein